MTITAAIILAAGRGTRAGAGAPKQYRLLAGRPVLAHTLEAFDLPQIGLRVLVLPPEDFAAGAYADWPVLRVSGGETRAKSVKNALEAIENLDISEVLIHDGARPFASPDLIARVLDALKTAPAAAPALSLTDALWRGAEGAVIATQSREGLYRAQTPQGFDYQTILSAHRAHTLEAADDVEVARAQGHRVAIVAGAEENFKLTWAQDFDRAERYLEKARMDIRLGNGYDVHAFCEGDHVTLCGVKIPHSKGLLGHSDADVAMHALTDALYGALAEGDIGRHFPPTDPQWKGAASDIFLRHAAERVRARGYKIGNVDVTIICERPKITPHAPLMIARLADILGLEAGRVSVKATTSERLGFTGREEGIASVATATLIGA